MRFKTTLLLCLFSLIISAQVVNIPDTNFKNYLLDNSSINTNQDGEIQVSEAQNFSGSINVYNKNISDLTGIEKFINITSLNATKNNLTSIDVSANTALTSLSLSKNDLTSIDVSANTALTSLSLSKNNLTSIDLSANTGLQQLSLGNNDLTSLDLSSNTSLTDLNAPLNNLTSVDLPNSTTLYLILISNNNLTTLDISNNLGLEYLYCSENSITAIDVSNHTSLKGLSISYNNLTTLDVSANTSLTNLSISGNDFTSIDISRNTALRSFYASSLQLTSLDISNNTLLNNLYIVNNNLTELNLEKHTELKNLRVSNNALTSLDIAKNNKLTKIFVKNNALTSLNLANGINGSITYMIAQDNPNLTCIQHDTDFDPTTNSNWKKDDTANWSNDCDIPVLTVTPTSKNFEKVRLEETATQIFTITNSGTADLVISDIAINGANASEFSHNGTSKTLVPNATYDVTVTFAPTTEATKTATISLTANTSISTHTISLLGEGITEPEFSISPISKDFGNVEVAQTATQQFTITNTGNADLEISGIVINGTNASEFSHDGTTQTITPNATYNINVTFAPTSVGSKDASIAINDNAGNHTVALTGNATAISTPQFTINPTSKDFGDVQVGENATQQFTITNNGNANLVISGIIINGTNASEFSHDGTTQTIAPNATYNINVTFTPTSVGSKAASIAITDNAGNHTISLTGNATAIPTPQFAINPTNKNFGDVQVGQNATQQFTITNNGNANLVISGIIINGTNASEFSHDGTTQTIAPNATYNINVTFAPTSVGNKAASIAINDNAGNHTVALTGNATATPTPQFTINPTSKDFGDIQVGQNATQQFTITNNGNADLEISSIVINGTNAGEFSHDGTTQTIAPNATYNINVTFAPTSVGSKAASIAITDNAGNHTVALTGNGITNGQQQQQTITWEGNTIIEIGCDGNNSFTIDATTNSNLPLTYEVVNTEIATLEGNIVNFTRPGTTIIKVSQPGNSSYLTAQPILKTITYKSNSLIQQHWNDTLFFDNSNKEYTSWQWYKNGNIISGATQQYYYESNPLSGDFHVIAQSSDGAIETCVLSITASFSKNIIIAPNPVYPNDNFTVKSDFSNSDLSNARLTIITTSGQIVYQTTEVSSSTSVTAPNSSGMYIVSLQLNNGKNYSANLIVR